MDSKIQELKTQLGGRVSSVNAYDSNAARQTASPQAIPPMYTNRLVVSCAARKIEIVTSEELGRISVIGEFDVSLMTVNAKDRIGFKSAFAGNVKIGLSEYTVFTEDGCLSASQRSILRLDEIADLIACHELRGGEALHFYRNGLVLYVRREDLSSELVFFLVGLANQIPAGGNESNNIKLPPEFEHLENLAQDWAIGDDVEKSDKIEDASEAQLQEFLAVIEPELDAITVYLERLGGDAPSEAAANLATLVETALEAQMSLARRTTPGPPTTRTIR